MPSLVCRGAGRGHSCRMREGLHLRMGFYQSLDPSDGASSHGACGFDCPIYHLHVLYCPRVFGCGEVYPKGLPRDGARHRPGNPLDPLGAGKLVGGRAFCHAESALVFEHPDVDVGFDQRMDGAARIFEPFALLDKLILLCVYERMRHPVEGIVRKHSQGKCPSDSTVMLGQPAHALPQGLERAGHTLVVHPVAKL